MNDFDRKLFRERLFDVGLVVAVVGVLAASLWLMFQHWRG